jgi:hypothetical protein
MDLNKEDFLTLRNLCHLDQLTPIEDIPPKFKSDFDLYFFGKTMMLDENNKSLIYPWDIKTWVLRLIKKYEIPEIENKCLVTSKTKEK